MVKEEENEEEEEENEDDKKERINDEYGSIFNSAYGGMNVAEKKITKI